MASCSDAGRHDRGRARHAAVRGVGARPRVAALRGGAARVRCRVARGRAAGAAWPACGGIDRRLLRPWTRPLARPRRWLPWRPLAAPAPGVGHGAGMAGAVTPAHRPPPAQPLPASSPAPSNSGGGAGRCGEPRARRCCRACWLACFRRRGSAVAAPSAAIRLPSRRRRRTLRRVARHRPRDDGRQRRRNVGAHFVRRRPGAVQHGVGSARAMSPVNALRPVEHLVEHDAQGIDVGARVDRAALQLLRRQVVRRAGHHAVEGRQHRRCGRRGRCRNRAPWACRAVRKMLAGLMSQCTTPRAWA